MGRNKAVFIQQNWNDVYEIKLDKNGIAGENFQTKYTNA